jgi:hypothetical protein
MVRGAMRQIPYSRYGWQTALFPYEAFDQPSFAGLMEALNMANISVTIITGPHGLIVVTSQKQTNAQAS